MILLSDTRLARHYTDGYVRRACRQAIYSSPQYTRSPFSFVCLGETLAAPSSIVGIYIYMTSFYDNTRYSIQGVLDRWIVVLFVLTNPRPWSMYSCN